MKKNHTVWLGGVTIQMDSCGVFLKNLINCNKFVNSYYHMNTPNNNQKEPVTVFEPVLFTKLAIHQAEKIAISEAAQYLNVVSHQSKLHVYIETDHSRRAIRIKSIKSDLTKAYQIFYNSVMYN